MITDGISHRVSQVLGFRPSVVGGPIDILFKLQINLQHNVIFHLINMNKSMNSLTTTIRMMYGGTNESYPSLSQAIFTEPGSNPNYITNNII